jgi:hypothetical protein
VSKQTIITAEHLNATHLGKRVTINGKYGTVMSCELKKISADYAIMPDFVSYGPCEEYMPKPLRYRKNVHIILHLSNQVNDDIKATVHGDTELVIEVNGK